ncbi:MAG: hypothetical protein KC619_18290 [Myxococcales bacterium]|nr:hypothetical protein [Myxococcales bacterium]
MRWWLTALVLVGCSCEDDATSLAADGYVRCHMADVQAETRHVGDLTLRFEDRTLTVEGMPSSPTVAVATGPLSGEAPEADLYIVLGGLTEMPGLDPHGGLVLAIAGGSDDGSRWQRALSIDPESNRGIFDATRLRLVRIGRLELVPVAGAPARYAATDQSCGRGPDEADEWALDPPGQGVTRVLVSWAAPEATGLLGQPAGDPTVGAIRAAAHAGPVVFAWPREDAAAVRPASGPWIVRGDGHREPPGWTLFEASDEGWRRRPDSP